MEHSLSSATGLGGTSGVVSVPMEQHLRVSPETLANNVIIISSDSDEEAPERIVKDRRNGAGRKKHKREASESNSVIDLT